MPHRRRRRSFWLVLVGTTAFLTVDPALFLVVAALALSGLALLWTLMLARLLLVDAIGRHAAPIDDAAQGACPFAAWRGRGAAVSSSGSPTSSNRGVFS
jgi:hypothetical protein